ncbi:hypothetical protein [Streptomyces sp. CB03911]|uniref:hypothetical protein n=1 Tax=Streptomyces sp. CB03911 TaxID=1804758 RepID=UPI00093E9225|nr:hypothetical protein [Streptomyces sp. CB03911]OKI19302.1 hypothetical protein A6A07_07310 [Streptomyces sp. CB03911]
MLKIFIWLKLTAERVALSAADYLRRLLVTEPVRVRAAVLAGVGALAVFVPALANASVAGQVTGVVLFILPLVLGEGARSKVSPVAG